MSHLSFKNVDKEVIKRLQKDLASYEIKSNNPHVENAYKPNPKLSVLVFKNSTILLQGEFNDKFLEKYNLQIPKQNTKSKTDLPKFNNYSVLGCDEVGVGDFFGPIVTCCAFVDPNWIAENQELASKIRDSKKITDEKILELYPQLAETIKYSVYIMGNKTYNESYEVYHNLNTLKVIAHNQALHNFAQVYPQIKLDYILMDQFVEKNLYFNHLYRNNINQAPFDIFFTTKAESISIAVACASIIARYFFLKAISKIEQELGFKILLGASTAVKKLVLQVKNNPNLDKSSYIKLNFNTDY